jgi:hypothetical protein
MEQDEDKRAETSSEDTRRRILPDASSPRRDDVLHAASDGEILQLFE